MPVHTWIHKVADLLTPALVKKDQYDAIKNAITEIQDNAITSVSNGDDSLDIEVREGEAIINFKTGDVQNQLILGVVLSVNWANPVLSYQPINLIFNGGKLTKIETVDAVVIDTAEACS